MKQQISNTIYGLLDYACYPIGMLMVAPVILRNLGTAQYGVWTIATSIVSLGSIVASGFGDANTQKVAVHRGAGSRELLLRVVRATMGVHLTLGLTMGAAIWMCAPILADRITTSISESRDACLACIRIAAAFVTIRALETVFISTQRAFERYGAAVRISLAARILGLAGAAMLALTTRNVANIMAFTMALAGMALIPQYIRLQRLLGAGPLWPSLDPPVSKDLLRFGVFTWLIAVAGVISSYGDRLLGGTWMGASGVVAYALCAQISQTLYGLTASGLHFLFPYIANRKTTSTPAKLRNILRIAFVANALLVLAGTGLLLACSNWILHALVGDSIAAGCSTLLPSVLAGSALLALSVSGAYAMVALGRVRFVSMLNLAGALSAAAVVVVLSRPLGWMAIVAGRIVFALVVLCVYVPLLQQFGGARIVLQTNRPTTEEA